MSLFAQAFLRDLEELAENDASDAGGGSDAASDASDASDGSHASHPGKGRRVKSDAKKSALSHTQKQRGPEKEREKHESKGEPHSRSVDTHNHTHTHPHANANTHLPHNSSAQNGLYTGLQAQPRPVGEGGENLTPLSLALSDLTQVQESGRALLSNADFCALALRVAPEALAENRGDVSPGGEDKRGVNIALNIAPKMRINLGGFDREVLKRCTDALQEIDREIIGLYKAVRDVYGMRFPELETLVPLPLDYLAVARMLGNNLKAAQSWLSSGAALTGVERPALPNPTLMSISVASATSAGSRLATSTLAQLNESYRLVDELRAWRARFLAYLETTIQHIAPNLSALLGASLAATLTAVAGGPENLASMPAQNILVLGVSAHSQESTVAALTAHGQARGRGLLTLSDIVRDTPPAAQKRALRRLPGACAKAIRMDLYGGAPSGAAVSGGAAAGISGGAADADAGAGFSEIAAPSVLDSGTSTSADASAPGAFGASLREELITALKKEQEPPKPRTKRPLPIPEEKPSKRRGGKRKRAMKKKYGLTEADLRKNRLYVNSLADSNFDISKDDAFTDEDE